MNIVLVGSADRCGIYEYSQILLDGFRQVGLQVRYLGVRNQDNHDLARQLKQVRAEDKVIIFEYEPGIFDLRGLVGQILRLRLRGKRVLLSIHEIEPARYSQYQQIIWRINQPTRYTGFLEMMRLVWASFDVARRYLFFRSYLFFFGWLPQVIIVHSSKARKNVRLINAHPQKVAFIPYLVKCLEGNQAEIRASLNLPQDKFAFIIAGFIFRRKQIIETIQQLPDDSELWIVGTVSEYDPDYLEEIHSYLAQNKHRGTVRFFHDYDRMEQYLLAADVSVLYYKEVYQSGIAAHSIGAGKPCIFSNLAGFTEYHQAGLVVQGPETLGHALREIQQKEVYRRLQANTLRLREHFAPAVIAKQYAEIAVNL